MCALFIHENVIRKQLDVSLCMAQYRMAQFDP